MENKSETVKAIEFLSSFRGEYIVGQALAVAIKTMSAVEPEYRREVSNIADMQFLLDNLFPLGKIAVQDHVVAIEVLDK